MRRIELVIFDCDGVLIDSVGGPQSDASTLRALGAAPFARVSDLPALPGVA